MALVAALKSPHMVILLLQSYNHLVECILVQSLETFNLLIFQAPIVTVSEQ